LKPYQGAVSLVFLSRHEGFGFPVLEAMAHGCPVITTKTTSIPEVAGNAALLFNPDDVPGISRGCKNCSINRKDAPRWGKASFKPPNFPGKKQLANHRCLARNARFTHDEPPAAPGHVRTNTVFVSRPLPAEKSAALEIPNTAEAAPTATCKRLADGSELELAWFAPWQNPSGYCSEALAFAQSLAPSVKLNLIDVANQNGGLRGRLPSN
jgi:hypothetical protein